jgi:hypothetical protein
MDSMAQSLNIQVQNLDVRSPDELDAALTLGAKAQVDGVVVADEQVFSTSDLIASARPDRDLGPLTLRGLASGGCAADELAAGRVPGEHQRAKRRCPPRTLCASGHGRSSLPQRMATGYEYANG